MSFIKYGFFFFFSQKFRNFYKTRMWLNVITRIKENTFHSCLRVTLNIIAREVFYLFFFSKCRQPKRLYFSQFPSTKIIPNYFLPFGILFSLRENDFILFCDDCTTNSHDNTSHGFSVYKSTPGSDDEYIAGLDWNISRLWWHTNIFQTRV